MPDETPSYYGMLPAKVRYDKRLRANEKIMFTEITALAKKYGYCSAGNNYFANLYEANKKTVSKWINDLKKCSHVLIEYDRKEKRIIQRRIYPLTDAKSGGIHQKMEGYPSKSEHPIHQKAKGNNTRDNNTRENRVSSESKDNSEANNNVSKLVESVQDVFGITSPIYYEKLSDYHDKLSIDLMLKGIEITKNNGKHNMNYLTGIYNNWLKSNIYTLKQYNDAERKGRPDQARKTITSSATKEKYKSQSELDKLNEKRMKEFEQRMENK